MKAVLSTRLGRTGLSLAVALLVLAGSYAYLRWAVEQGQVIPTADTLLRYLVAAPLFGGAVAFLALSLASNPPQLTPDVSMGAERAAEDSEAPSEPPVRLPESLQVLGVHWLSPLRHSGYSTLWHLLWAQGLAKPDRADERLMLQPRLFEKVKPVAPVVGPAQSIRKAFEQYLDVLLDQLHDSYFSDPGALYTVASLDTKRSRTLDGVFIACALPAEVGERWGCDLVRRRVAQTFELERLPPVVHARAGGPEAGLAALKLAQDYLRAYPSSSAWVLAWAAPNHPALTAGEGLVLTVLAGAEFDSARAPLGWLGPPVHAQPQRDDEEGAQVWGPALTSAALSIGRDGVGHVVYDVARAEGGIGPLVQGLNDAQPGFRFQRHTFDAALVFGNAGACAAPLGLALALSRIAHLGGGAAGVFAMADERGVVALALKAAAERPTADVRALSLMDSEAQARSPWWARPEPASALRAEVAA